MGVKYLWDTNTAGYYLKQLFPGNTEALIDELTIISRPTLSSITEIELLSWRNASLEDIDLLRNFIADSLIIELERSVKSQTVEIRRNYKTKLPDAIIAATAMVHGLTLITHNLKDFAKKEGLKVIDPWNL